MSKFIHTLQSEVKTLSYPTKEQVVKKTAITLVSAIILAALITLDSNGVSALCNLIVSLV